jgi:glycosidase
MDPDSRRAFPWDAARWDEALLGAVRDAFALRRAEPALRADGLTISSATDGGMAYVRRGPTGALWVALNAGQDPTVLLLPDAGASLAGDPHSEGGSVASVLLAMGRARSIAPRLVSIDGRPALELAPRSGAVVRIA